MCARGMSTHPITPHRLCGRCWIGQRGIVGQLWCAATRDSATRRSCAKPSSAALAYLFKLRLTANVRRAIERLSQQSEWVDSGQGWQAKETQVRLKGWSRQRRIIVLRRRVKGEFATPSTDEAGQRRLTFVDILP